MIDLVAEMPLGLALRSVGPVLCSELPEVMLALSSAGLSSVGLGSVSPSGVGPSSVGVSVGM